MVVILAYQKFIVKLIQWKLIFLAPALLSITHDVSIPQIVYVSYTWRDDNSETDLVNLRPWEMCIL